MVIPGWRYLVSGGTTGQVFTKVSGEDGDYEWSNIPSGSPNLDGGTATTTYSATTPIDGGNA